jgi:hypothetical protein
LISSTRLQLGQSRMQLRDLAQKGLAIIGHVLVNLLEHLVDWLR